MAPYRLVVVKVIGVGVDLQHGGLRGHLERTSVSAVVLGQGNVGAAVDVSRGHLTLYGNNADVHVRAGMHVVVAVDLLLAVIRHGRRTIAILVDDRSVVTLGAALRAALFVFPDENRQGFLNSA